MIREQNLNKMVFEGKRCCVSFVDVADMQALDRSTHKLSISCVNSLTEPLGFPDSFVNIRA